MKKIISLVLLFIFVLSSCSNLSDKIGTYSPVISTSEALKSSTQTHSTFIEVNKNAAGTFRIPSATNRPTQTLTPEPSFTLTVYPTYVLKLFDTPTQQEPAQCPEEDPNFQIPDEIFSETFTDFVHVIVIDLLLSGASFNQIITAFGQHQNWFGNVELMDLTFDGIPELLIEETDFFVVMSCYQGGYREILNYSCVAGSGILEGCTIRPHIYSIQDMNLNGIPEIILSMSITNAYEEGIDILEWDGFQFNSLIQANHGEKSPSTSVLAETLYWYADTHEWFAYSDNRPVMTSGAHKDIQDLDRNGTKELILSDQGPSRQTLYYYSFGPWRGKQVVFEWDGIHFLYSSLEMDSPMYRFQAVQDADRYFLLGDLDRALTLYQDVIFSDRLDWWSGEKMQYLERVYLAGFSGEQIPAPPQQDANEYSKLAAYARYRIFLHHLARGWISDAEVVYKTLWQKYPIDSVGHNYASMAQILWETYKATKNLDLACPAVIEYARNHPEILSPLGDHEHGLQSHIYVPEDVCPFPPIGS